MKKLLLLFVASFIYILNTSAQWSSGGTQLTFTPTQDFEMSISASSLGGYYITFRKDTLPTDSTGWDYIMVNAYDSLGGIKPGWAVGGISLTKAGIYYSPQLITTSDDGVIVTWYGNDTSRLNKTQNIYFQKYSSTGQPLWNGGVPVQMNNDNAHLDKYPFIISDRNKGAYIAWDRYDLNIDYDSLDLYIQHIDSTGNVAPGWNILGDKAAGMPYREDYPNIVLTRDQASIYLAYSATPDSVHLYLNKFNTSDGSVASGWISPGTAITQARPNIYPARGRNFSLFCDTLGNATVLWIEARTTGNGEMYMNQISPSGTRKLGLTGKYLIGNNFQQAEGLDYMEAVQDKDYNLLITTNDYNFTNVNGWSDVDALKVNPNGTVYWSKIAITGDDYSEYPKPVTDGKHGMYIFYEDSVVLKNLGSLRALALDSTGKIYSGWKAPGSYFSELIDPDGFNPNLDFSSIATDTRKGIVAWTKEDSKTNLYIFSCNLWSNGNVCTNDPIVFTSAEAVDFKGMNCLIYPNPFDEYATVVINNSSNQSGSFILKLFDLTGKEMNEYNLNAEGETNINTSQLAQGMYFYQLVNKNEQIQNGKLIKQ